MDNERLAMTKKELMQSLREAAGCDFISQNKVRKWYGGRFEQTAELLTDLAYTSRGRTKMYYIGDVAEAVMKRREYQ